MSRSGHLILILDGFDEMRHAMDFEDFLYVFEQMQPLFQGNSKVILLGRPDSFLTNREEDEAIAALFESGANVDRKIKKSEVAFFSREDISRYIDHYIQKREKPFSSEQRARLEKILKEIPDKDDSILSRPVQLRMFTTIMDDLLIVGLYTGSFLVRRRSLPVRISRLRQRPLH
jgi:predicted NACHT family NTPase